MAGSWGSHRWGHGLGLRWSWGWIIVGISGCRFQRLISSLRHCGTDEDDRRGLANFHCFVDRHLLSNYK